MSIDALAKQLSILEADCTTLETLQKLSFLRMIALKRLQKNWDFEDDYTENAAKTGIFVDKCTKSTAKAGKLAFVRKT